MAVAARPRPAPLASLPKALRRYRISVAARLRQFERDRAQEPVDELERPDLPDSAGPVTVPEGGLLGHIQHFYPGYQAGALHKLIAREVEAILSQPSVNESGHSRKWLMLFVPPQHGKTEVVSVQAPAWYLGSHPDAQWVNASYASPLAERNSRYARDIVRSGDFAAMHNVRLSLQSNSVSEWTLAGHRGGLKAIGVGGGLTGNRADVLVVDDPVKDRQDANSPTVRTTTIDWWRAVARTRLHPDSVVILIMTRWHFGDLAGHLLEQDAERVKNGGESRWRVVRIPARADSAQDPLGRPHNAVLWPERFTRTIVDDDGIPHVEINYAAAEAFYNDLQVDLGPGDWASLGQQTPSLGDSAIFKPSYWNWYDPRTDLPPVHMSNRGFLFIVQFWDTAFKEKQTSDFCACVTLGVTGRGIYLLDVYNQRHEMPGLLAAGKGQHAKWGPTHLVVENKASGPSMAQMLKVATERLMVELYDYHDGAGDKIARANAVVPMCAGPDGSPGLVHMPIPGSVPGVDEFLTQLYQFPAATHDDMVDAFVGALQKVKDLTDGARRMRVDNSGYSGGGDRLIEEHYIDRDTGRAPSPGLVGRR